MAYRYHPEIEGLKTNELGTEVVYLNKPLVVKEAHRGGRKSVLSYVCCNSSNYSVAKLVCECWHGMPDNPRWVANKKDTTKGVEASNLYWAPRGNPPAGSEMYDRKRARHKIPASEVPKIEERIRNKESLRSICKDYGVTNMSIQRIKNKMKSE